MEIIQRLLYFSRLHEPLQVWCLTMIYNQWCIAFNVIVGHSHHRHCLEFFIHLSVFFIHGYEIQRRDSTCCNAQIDSWKSYKTNVDGYICSQRTLSAHFNVDTLNKSSLSEQAYITWQQYNLFLQHSSLHLLVNHALRNPLKLHTKECKHEALVTYVPTKVRTYKYIHTLIDVVLTGCSYLAENEKKTLTMSFTPQRGSSSFYIQEWREDTWERTSELSLRMIWRCNFILY